MIVLISSGMYEEQRVEFVVELSEKQVADYKDTLSRLQKQQELIQKELLYAKRLSGIDSERFKPEITDAERRLKNIEDQICAVREEIRAAPKITHDEIWLP